MNMNQMKKLYREEHGTQAKCPVCEGKKELRKGCCASGSVLVYPPAAPGLRKFARLRSPDDCTGKLATILGRR